MTSSGSSGRAASCTNTTAASSGTSARANRTDSDRVAPPVTTELTLPAPISSATRMHGSSHSGGAAITIMSIQGEPSSRSRLSASSGLPPRRANAFGRSDPSRSPRPAAARTAQTDTAQLSRSSNLGGALLRLLGAAGEDVVEPLGRLLLVHGLCVHELSGEDLLGLDQHLLLPR